MAEVSEEMRTRGFQICKDFLGGCWNRLEPCQFHIERIKGGMSNMMYMCSIPEGMKTEGEEPRKVLLRIYGQIIQENPETVVTDSVIYSLLAEKGMGPKLHGVFTGGRVEEYLKSHHLSAANLRNCDISLACAKVMAGFHKLRMPLIKEPRWIFETITRYLDDALNNITFVAGDEVQREKLQKVLSFGLASEFQYLKKLCSKIESPVVFCHNDLQEGNILYSESEDDPTNWWLTPIDFEYASYNYRGFDIGNHFCEWCYDYEVDHAPYFSSDLSLYPNKKEQLQFIRAYLDRDPKDSASPRPDEQEMLKEIAIYTLVSDFFWAVWALVQAQISNINFGYLDYAMARFEAYYSHKKDLPPLFKETNGIALP